MSKKESFSKSGTGIIICGGGYRYFTNAWVAVRALRHCGCQLPIQIWMWRHELHTPQATWVADYNATIQVVKKPTIIAEDLPARARWQWMLKPLALLKSNFRHILLLDADNFALRDPSYLFVCPQYLDTGAVFWPDVPGQVLAKREIWKEMNIPWRDEPEFESGQMVLDTLRHRDPLQMALQMNKEANKYYNLLWGDKDTFRFAFHKFGRTFSMVPWPLQLLSLPGMPQGSPGVMCQHDFQGNRLFQHRNMAKWNLLARNPRIAGYFNDEESRTYLAELRSLWNGRVNWSPPGKADYSDRDIWHAREKLLRKITGQIWLVEDMRPQTIGCCSPLQVMTETNYSKPWTKRSKHSNDTQDNSVNIEDSIKNILSPHASVPSSDFKPEDMKKPNAGITRMDQLLKRREISFQKDYTIVCHASDEPDFYWWDLEYHQKVWCLYLRNESGKVICLKQDGENCWKGKWLRGDKEAVVLQSLNSFWDRSSAEKRHRPNWGLLDKPLSVANHAYGIGDAVTGLVAALNLANTGGRILYHTRHAGWLRRVSHPLLEITESSPSEGTIDIDSDYPEQLRYAHSKVK